MGAVKSLVIAHGREATRKMLAQPAPAPPPAGPVYFSARWSEEDGRWLVHKRQGSPRRNGWEDGIDPDRDAALADVEGLPAMGRTIPWSLLARIVRAHAKEDLPLRVWHKGGWCNGG